MTAAKILAMLVNILLLRLLVAAVLLFVIGIHAAILRTGNPLMWPNAKPYLHHVRLSGVKQFLNHYVRCNGIEMPMFLWGDEIEYGVFKHIGEGQFDLYLNASTLRDQLNAEEKHLVDLPVGCQWQPEYGSWMVEAVPRNPYGSYVSDLMNVEKSMLLRRKRLEAMLQRVEAQHGTRLIAPTLSNFPLLGVPSQPHAQPVRGPVANSEYIADAIINPFVRFGTLTKNIRLRRGSNVNILVPRDQQPDSSAHTTDVQLLKQQMNEEFIHMDAMAFGMGCCCVQVSQHIRCCCCCLCYAIAYVVLLLL